MWDLAVEKDEEEEGTESDAKLKDLPPQLLFIHQVWKSFKFIRYMLVFWSLTKQIKVIFVNFFNIAEKNTFVLFSGF